jgi:hypothetical protein
MKPTSVAGSYWNQVAPLLDDEERRYFVRLHTEIAKNPKKSEKPKKSKKKRRWRHFNGSPSTQDD